jgi:hypothetical protein
MAPPTEEQLEAYEKARADIGADNALDFMIKEREDAIMLTLKGHDITGNFDPLREIGLDRDRKMRQRKVEASTSPAAFIAAKEAAIKKMENNVKMSYYGVYDQYVQAGHPTSYCKQQAITAAIVTRDLGMQAIESEFGTDNNDVADYRQAAEAATKLSGLNPKFAG